MPLRFLHISDIHFQKFNNTFWDLDSEVRNEIERDLVAFCETNGKIDAVLIGGDVAFSGKEEEYEEADKWLSKLSGIIKCGPEYIFTIPGNHDVDRTKIGELLLTFHSKLRVAGKRNNIDEQVKRIFNNDGDLQSFMKPLENYFKFAAKYGSTPSDPSQLYWDKTFDLGPIKVKIRGANSALISNSNDDENTNKLVLCSPQLNVVREDNAVNIFMCHHPPEWIFHGKEIEKELLAKCHIHLYGHIHQDSITETNGRLILSAGAIQPERNEEGWKPCYNIVELDVLSEQNNDFLKVKIWKRHFDKKKSWTFIPDQGSGEGLFQEFNLKMDRIVSKKMGTDKVELKQESLKENYNNETEIIDVKKEDFVQKLSYWFLSLPYHNRVRIAVKMDLLEDSDESLAELNKSRLYFTRARDKKELKQLWDLVMKYNPELNQPNPFNP